VRRAWCALELYETILGRDAAYLHDIYTVMSNAGPIGLVDGLAAKSGKKKEDTMDKAEREQEFPDAALCGAKGFALAHAEASRAEDLVAIRGQVGADDKVLDATVRARFGVARLHAVLRADNPGGKAELRALLDDLRGSKLRKLSALLHAKSHPALALLGAALPASLEELTLYDAGPSVAPPLCKLIDGGRLPLLRTLHLWYARRCGGDGRGAGRSPRRALSFVLRISSPLPFVCRNSARAATASATMRSALRWPRP